MKTSDTLDLLTPALVKAQGAIPAIKKDAANPFYKSSYLSLEGLLAVVKPILTAHGFALLQFCEDADDAALTVTTRLQHTSGQWVEGGVRLPIKEPTPQAAGSAFSYGKRYTLEALLAVTGTEDDDGNSAQVHAALAPPASRPGPKSESKPVPTQPRPESALPDCPTCGGPVWDNRPKKASGQFKPNSPDFACKDKACGGKIWPKKEAPVGVVTGEEPPIFDDQEPY